MGGHETILLLGADHAEPGAVTTRAVTDGRSACAISAGASAGGSKMDANEDAVLVVDTGDSCLLAAADAHYGASSSHRLLERIAAEVSPDVRNLFQLGEALEVLRDDEVDPDEPSETTLVVAVMQREARRGFGLSFGDSSCALLPLDGGGRVLTKKQPGFITLARPEMIAREEAFSFRFLVSPGDLVAVYTDGVDECHYRRPKTSVGLRHLESLLASTGSHPAGYADALASMALAGVDGNPGGEDNLAIAVASA